MFPVSFCSFFVLRARMVGAYDSRIVISELMATAPLCKDQLVAKALILGRVILTAMAKTQKVHLQPFA